ncbi:MAG: phosphatase PAP2 family protein [Agriterribacter sp.]
MPVHPAAWLKYFFDWCNQYSKFLSLSVFSSAIVLSVAGQYSEDIQYYHPDTLMTSLRSHTLFQTKSVRMASVIIPGAMIMYGIGSIHNNQLKSWNENMKYELYLEHPHGKFPIDDYLQFTPALAVYGLNALDVKGAHNFKDRTIIYVMSNIILNATVFPAKRIAHEQRPDGSDFYSFPSGHTAEAFASAEFLMQEYKNVSLWYGIAGYATAAATGYLRMYNNKHWFGDVAAGAGVGILSTKLAYWLYPFVKRNLFSHTPINTFITPTYQQGAVGIALAHTF